MKKGFTYRGFEITPSHHNTYFECPVNDEGDMLIALTKTHIKIIIDEWLDEN